MSILYRFLLRRRLTGSGVPADHLNGELFADEPNYAYYYGHGLDTGGQAVESHLLFLSDGDRLWHDIVGKADGTTEFVGDGSGLTGVVADSVAWADVTGKPATFPPSSHTHTVADLSDASANGRSLISAVNYAAMRTLLNVANGATAGATWGTDLGSIPAAIDAIDGLTPAADRYAYYTGASTASLGTITAFARSILDDADAATVRGTLGLGSIATQAASSVAITGGAITGIADLAVADGGTGASTASGARTNLGLVIGTDVQGYDATLAALAGLDGTTGLLEQTGVDTFAKRAMGTGASTSILTRADGDGRYAAASHTQAWSTITSTPTTLSGYGIMDGQPLDATLTALAGVTTAANKLIYATGSDAFTTADLTAFARTILDDADAATVRGTIGAAASTHTHTASEISDASANGRSILTAADYAAIRTLLGLVIGTNVQAYDAELAALAGLTSAADKAPYFTGAGAAALADLTALGRALIALGSGTNGNIPVITGAASVAMRAILGTVSQTSGVPDGALFERGSTVDGVYERFANGLQICRSGVLTGDATTAVGSQFRMATAGTWTLPASFVDTTYTVIATPTNNLLHTGTARQTSSSAVEYQIFSNTSQTGRGIRLTAIGRWF